MPLPWKFNDLNPPTDTTDPASIHPAVPKHSRLDPRLPLVTSLPSIPKYNSQGKPSERPRKPQVLLHQLRNTTRWKNHPSVSQNPMYCSVDPYLSSIILTHNTNAPNPTDLITCIMQ